MAKQKSRPEKRYVPQQESYRNLPGLRPTADTIVAAETPAPDASGLKLRQLAEGLAAGNSALKDFFTMEKSFEETNRVAQKAQALLGLPQLEQGPGRGFLDYGSDYGYQEGQGQADSIRTSQELKTALAEQNYFVDVDDPTGTTTKINQFTQQFIQDKMGDRMKNPAYAEGAAKYMAAAKVEALTEAAVALENQKFQRQVDSATTIANQRLSEAPPEVWADPQKLREFLGDINKDSERRGLNRDASTEITLLAISDTTKAEYTKASDTSDLKAMSASIQKFKTVVDATHLKDTSGMALGGVAKAPDGTIKWKLEAPVNDLKTQLHSMVADYDTEVSAKRKVQSAELESQIFQGLQDKTLSTTDARSLVSKEPDAEVRNGLMKRLTALENSKDYINDELVVQQALLDPGLTVEKVLSLNSRQLLSTDGYSKLMQTASKINAAQTNVLIQQEKRARLSESEDNKFAKEIDNNNKLVIAQVELERGYVPPEERGFLQNISKSGNPLTKEDVGKALDNYSKGLQASKVAVQKLVDDKTALRAAKEAEAKQLTESFKSFTAIPQDDLNDDQKSTLKKHVKGFISGDTAGRDALLKEYNKYSKWKATNRPRADDLKAMTPEDAEVRETIFYHRDLMHNPLSSADSIRNSAAYLSQLGVLPNADTR